LSNSSSNPHSVQHYQRILDSLAAFTGLVLACLARGADEAREKVMLNFLARSRALLAGVAELWQIHDYHDCWVLYRCLLDRVFHMQFLIDGDQFDLFDNWCFVQAYEYENKVRSDAEFKHRIDATIRTRTPSDTARYKALKKGNVSWTRPKAQDVTKDMDLRFLYKYGYDYASTAVHPMSFEGQEDLRILMGSAPQSFEKRHIYVIGNSCLAVTLLIQQIFNHGSFCWRTIMFDFLSQIRRALADGTTDFELTIRKLQANSRSVEWCRRRGHGEAFDRNAQPPAGADKAAQP